jgi:hypothetical protein
MQAEKRPFETWAVVELMGHHQIAGRVTEESIAGTNMLRVDVPELSAERPGHTKYFGGGSIYAIHPCTEAIARQVADRLAHQYGFTPLPVAVPDLTQAMDVIRRAEAARAAVPALPSGASVEDDDDDDEYDDGY